MSQASSADINEASPPRGGHLVHSLLAFTRVLRHRYRTLVGAVVIAGVLGGLYYLTATRIYSASAQILVVANGNDVWNPSMTAEGQRQGLLPTYEQLFSSAVVLDGALRILEKADPSVRIDLLEKPREKWQETIRANLSVSTVRRTNIMKISYRSKSPEAAVVVVNAIVKSYLEFMEKNHSSVASEIKGVLTVALEDNQKKKTEKEAQLLRMREQLGTLDISEASKEVHPLVQTVFRFNEALVQAQQKRVQLEASLAAVKAAQRNGGDIRQHLVSIEPLVGKELMLRSLGLSDQDSHMLADVQQKAFENRARLKSVQEHYGPTHPKVVELAEAIRSAEMFLNSHQDRIAKSLDGMNQVALGNMLASMLREQIAFVSQQETRLLAEYRSAESQAMAMSNQVTKLRMVENDLRLISNLNDTLVTRISNITISANQTDLRVTQIGLPVQDNRPVSPRLSLVGLFCLALGFLGGVAAVYVLDVLDDRFRSPEELRDQLGVPVLAMIRKFEMPPGQSFESLKVHIAPDSLECEAFRTLRTSLALSGEEFGRLAITSSEPGDGKTTVMANLALSFAHAGKRTLLIDGDMRRPGLSKLFELRGLPGLSDLLRGEENIDAMADQLVQATEVPNFFILPCGVRVSDPSELLATPRLAELFAWAENHFDEVLIDAPPTLAATDAAVIGRQTDGVLLVVQPEKNHRRRVLRAVESLTRFGVRIHGTIVNRVDDRGDQSYYYDSGYGYGYGYGQEEAEETAELAPRETSASESVLSLPEEPKDRGESEAQPRRRRAA